MVLFFVSLFPDCHQVTIYSHNHSHLDEFLYHRSTDNGLRPRHLRTEINQHKLIITDILSKG